MTIIMLIMMFTLLLLFASQGSLALVPEGMWHNHNNNNNNTPLVELYFNQSINHCYSALHQKVLYRTQIGPM